MRGKCKSVRNNPHSTASSIAENTRRKKVPQQVRQGHGAGVKNPFDAIAILNSDGTIRYESPSIEHMLGYRPDELVGKTILEFIHPDDIQIAANTFEGSAINLGQPLSMEVRFQHKDGSWRLFEGTGSNLLDDPQVNGIVINYRDITENKIAKDTLQDTERLYRIITENVTDVIWMMDMNLNFTYISPSTERLTGYTPEEEMAIGLAGIMTEESLGIAFKTYERGLSGENRADRRKPFRSLTVDMDHIHKDGHIIPTEVRMTFLRDIKGKPIGILGITRDITKRREMEQEIQRSEESHRLIMESLQDGVMVVDLETMTVVFSNNQGARFFGYDSSRDLLGVDALSLVHPDDYEIASRAFVEDIHKERRQRYELRLAGSDDVVKWVNALATRIEYQGKPAVLISIRDITEKKFAEKAILEAEGRYKAIFDNRLQMVYVNNDTGLFLDANDYALELLGYSRDDLGKVSFQDILHPEDHATAFASVEEILRKGFMEHPIELRLISKSGQIIWVETFNIPLERTVDHFIGIGIARDITETKQMEIELKESEEKLKRYLEGSPDVICVTDLKGTLLYINEAGERLTGYQREEIVGQNFLRVGLLSPRHVSKPKQWIEAGGTERKFKPDEYEVIRKDGSRVFVEVSTLSICPGDDVSKTEIIGIVRDISDRKQMEESLLIKEKAIENSLNAIAMSDMAGNITYVNKSCLRLWGNDSNEEIIGKPYWTLLSADEVPISKEIVQAIFDKGYWEGEVSATNRDGKQIYVQIATGLIKDDEGNPIQTISSFIDITERKIAEKALRESEAYYSALVVNVPDAVFKYVDGHIVWGNDVIEKIIGYTKDELLNKDVNLFLPDDHSVPEITRTVYPILKEQGTFHGTTTAKRKNGEIAHIEYSASQIPDKYPVEIVGVARDVTERIRAEQEREQLTAELAEKNREQEQIIYVTSHDLRSPLVNVQGFSKELGYSLKELASVLQSENISQHVREKLQSILETDITDSLGYIETSISKMDSLLSGLLRLSRLGRAALSFEQLNMNTLLSDIQKAFEYRIKESGVSVEIGDLPPCIGDAVQINQVFSNLLDNALKYLDHERAGVVKITGGREENKAVYCVEDNGIGIAEEHRSKIFEIFHRLNPSETSGEGLGLSIIRKILSRHNGKIWVESEPGTGSKFFVSLPAVE